MFLADPPSVTGSLSCPIYFLSQLQFLTVMPITFSLPRVRAYPGGPQFAPGMRCPALFCACIGGYSPPGLFSVTLLACSPLHVLTVSPSHLTIGEVILFHSLKMHLVSLGLSRGGIKVEAEPSEYGEPSGLGTEPPALPSQAGQRAPPMERRDFPSVLPALCFSPQCRA